VEKIELRENGKRKESPKKNITDGNNNQKNLFLLLLLRVQHILPVPTTKKSRKSKKSSLFN
jgi:hypothetical protein